jgi:hypothetical protein
MNISNLGRLVGAGLLAVGLHAFAPSTTAQALSGGLPDDVRHGGNTAMTSTPAVVGQTALNPARAAAHSTRNRE